jgi:LysM repeat protein
MKLEIFLSFQKEDEKMSANRVLQAGLVLVVVAACFSFPRSASAGSGCGPTYVVQPGDWLSKIAARCGFSLSALYAANPWASYYRYIYPGQVLVIPGGPAGPGPGPGNPFCGPSYRDYYGYSYVVCRGDTLGKIANYYGVSWSYLQWHNHIANPNLIYAGQFIYP